MFRKTNTNRQLSLLSGVNQNLTQVSSRYFSDKNAWHNTFCNQIVNRIDETIFSVLYADGKGSPNASVKVLIGMMILKEGKGYSDEELFENCRFNLLTRKALGLVNMDDAIPAESTYYLLRKRISDYETEHGINLFDQCFKQITGKQILEFEVSGKSIRTDSKLIGSNIAFYSRYELINKVLKLFYKHVFKQQTALLSKENQDFLEDLLTEKASSTVYKADKEQIKDRLIRMGKLIYDILAVSKNQDNAYYLNLKRIFDEQYKVLENNNIEAKQGKEINARSMQSPYDTDCDFRSKNGKGTKGYSHNITETCAPDNKVNLITDVQVERATQADNDFIEPAAENSNEILPDKIENIHADGAYNSDDNQDYTRENNISFYLTGFQGKPGRYDLELIGNTLQVTDTHTGEQIPAKTTKNGKYRIKTETGFRYFTDDAIESCRLRKQVDELPQEISNRRNNVEATIFQLAYKLRKDKTKYRGKFKNKIWATLRSLWINYVRIAEFLRKSAEGICVNANNTLHFGFFIVIWRIILFLTQSESHRNNKMIIH